MRKKTLWMMAAALLLTFAACKKVELQPLEQDAILPLAVGNRWVYADSFITTTSLPSSDTVVSIMAYEVKRARWIDQLTVDDRGKKTMERYQGWEIEPSSSEFTRFTVVVIGDTLYSNAFNRIFWAQPSGSCPAISGSIGTDPRLLRFESIDGAFWPILARPGQLGDSIVHYPAFHEISSCIGIGPSAYPSLTYSVPFSSLKIQSLAQSVTTGAGTFTCVNFGSQWWAEGVGMVQTYHEGATIFYDQQQRFQTAQLRWKRSLLSYMVN